MKNLSKFFLCLSLVFLFLFNSSGTNQQAQTTPPLTVQQVKGNIYEVKGGSGANTGFFIGEKEVLVIDAKMSIESMKQTIEEIKKLTPNPITYAVLTHSDGDHVNGLIALPETVKIIAHSQARKDLDEAFKEPVQRAYLPQLTFSEKLNFYSGKKVINFIHFGPAHTSGDVVVYFPEEKVAFLGDLLFIGRDPLVHRHKNGNSFGLVKNLKGVLELEADTFIHGHGDIASRSDVEGLIKSLEEKQEKIKSLIKDGKSLDEIKKIFNVEDRPTQPGAGRFISLVETIYLELTEKK